MKKNICKFILMLTISVLVLNGPVFFAEAVTQTDLNNLKQKLNTTQQQTSSKQKEASDLQQQIQSVDKQINQTESAISQTQSQIGGTNKTIAELDVKIQNEQSNLDHQQERMSRVISSWYMEGESGLLEAMISSNTLSDIIDQQQYYESIRQQLQSSIEEINKTKADLAAQKDEQANQLQILNGLKDDQVSQQQNLAQKKTFKNSLLSNTTSTIANLKKQETDLKAKIDEIAAQLSAAYSGGVRQQGTDILPSIDSSWYQTQLGNYTRLGDSPYANVNVHNYGCYITSLAMMASYWHHPVTNTQIATTVGIFSDDGYLMGFNSPGLGISLGPLQPVDRATLNRELDNGYPVIASVRLDSFRGRYHPNKDGSDHFIVIKSRSGDRYYMHDPAQGRGYRFSDVVSIKIVRP